MEKKWLLFFLTMFARGTVVAKNSVENRPMIEKATFAGGSASYRVVTLLDIPSTSEEKDRRSVSEKSSKRQGSRG